MSRFWESWTGTEKLCSIRGYLNLIELVLSWIVVQLFSCGVEKKRKARFEEEQAVVVVELN